MDDQTQRDILDRIDELERKMPQLVRGQVADVLPLDVKIGGDPTATEGANATRYDAVPALNSSQAQVGDVVHALKIPGANPLILGRPGNGITFGVTFPPLPHDGDEHIYPFGNGVLWPFRFNATGAVGKKWEAKGSPTPAYDEITASQTTASVTNTNLTTVGPSITVPFAGDYMADLRAAMRNSANGGNSIAALCANGTEIGTENILQMQADTATASALIPGGRLVRVNGLAAADVLTLKYRVDTGTGTWRRRSLAVAPVRVSG